MDSAGVLDDEGRVVMVVVVVVTATMGGQARVVVGDGIGEGLGDFVLGELESCASWASCALSSSSSNGNRQLIS